MYSHFDGARLDAHAWTTIWDQPPTDIVSNTCLKEENGSWLAVCTVNWRTTQAGIHVPSWMSLDSLSDYRWVSPNHQTTERRKKELVKVAEHSIEVESGNANTERKLAATTEAPLWEGTPCSEIVLSLIGHLGENIMKTGSMKEPESKLLWNLPKLRSWLIPTSKMNCRAENPRIPVPLNRKISNGRKWPNKKKRRQKRTSFEKYSGEDILIDFFHSRRSYWVLIIIHRTTHPNLLSQPTASGTRPV